MNEWLKKTIGKFKDFWKSASIVKKVILLGVVALIIVVIIVAANVSSAKTTVKVFNTAVTNQSDLIRIQNRLEQENLKFYVDEAGIISADDTQTATYLRTLLMEEGLVPSNIDPFADYYERSWSTTDAEQNVKLKNAIQNTVKQHLEVNPDISSASVMLTLPSENLFRDNQKPVTASVILTLRHNSDLASSKNRMKGIQNLILTAVEGLKAENLTIADNFGNLLNDFEGQEEWDKIKTTEKQLALNAKIQNEVAEKTKRILSMVVGEDCVTDVQVTIGMDWSDEESESTIFTPVIITDQDPDKPYDTTEKRDYLPRSRVTVTKTFEGTGFNPEGPAGVEGQNPPVYNDPTNVVGKSTETGVTENNELNTTHTKRKKAVQKDTIHIAGFIDGKWSLKLDENGNEIWKGNRREWECILPTEKEVEEMTKTIFTGTGCNSKRGDGVRLTAMAFNHDKEHAELDEAELRAAQTRKTILMVLCAIAIVLVGFILFRIISKEIEKRKRLREEELFRQQQAAREQQLWDAKDDANMQVTMSVEESRRAELLENAVNLAKEHPEDVALLIRTWLMEE